jgi:hypothetical protein
VRIRPHVGPRTSNPLARSHLKVAIADLMAEYELRLVFRNDGGKPI